MEQSKLPMIELHLHLDGAIPPKTMWALAQEKKIPMPAETLEGFRHWLVETSDCADVNTYLARFELPLQLMQDEKSIARVTKDLMTELSRQGHIYDEIRFAPQLHRREGLTQRQAIEAVLEGRRQALAENPGYDAGILLCAMCIGPETVNMAENLETVRLAKEFLGRGVVGADLAGAEGIVPLQSFHPVFDLARELGVGRSTVREAIKRLVARNILTARQGAGTFVSEKNGVPEDPLGLTFMMEEGSENLALDLQDIRLMLEPETCAIVARGATPEQIDQMQAYCDEVTRLIEAEEDYSAADAKFHRYLAECSGNHVLPNLIPIIASAIGVVITVTNDEHRSQSGMEHQRIVDAIRRHDPEGAKYSMIAHLNTSRNSMLHSRDNCAAKR